MKFCIRMIFLLGLMSAVAASMMDISPDMRPHIKRDFNNSLYLKVHMKSVKALQSIIYLIVKIVKNV